MTSASAHFNSVVLNELTLWRLSFIKWKMRVGAKDSVHQIIHVFPWMSQPVAGQWAEDRADMCPLWGKAVKSCYISIHLLPSHGNLGSQSFQTAKLEDGKGSRSMSCCLVESSAGGDPH